MIMTSRRCAHIQTQTDRIRVKTLSPSFTTFAWRR